jgi:hypothetical protein
MYIHILFSCYQGANTGWDVPGEVLALVGAGNGGIV